MTISRNYSQELLKDPANIIKHYSGISRIKRHNSNYTIKMIPKTLDMKEEKQNLVGKIKDLDRLCLLFGYNVLNKKEFNNKYDQDGYIPTKLYRKVE